MTELCEQLDALARNIDAISVPDGSKTLAEMYGWNYPLLAKSDCILMVDDLIEELKNSGVTSTDENSDSLSKRIALAKSRVSYLNQQIIQLMLAQNTAQQSMPTFIFTIEYIRNLFRDLYSWKRIGDRQLIPSELKRKLLVMRRNIDEITPDVKKLEEHVKMIIEARGVSDSLPVVLDDLNEASIKMKNIVTRAEDSMGQISGHLIKSSSAFDSIKEQRNEAEKLIQKCEDAYNITTTKGLAGAFDSKASQLTTSMWVWVVLLAASLCTGAYLGIERFKILSDIILRDATTGQTAFHIITTLVGIGAPIWFAWISTKQIGQRFQLAEDYAFKASIAKAYEGYRKEAVRIDKGFEKRLFDNALTRLEEAPLRLVNDSSPGSPVHEMINSNAAQKCISASRSIGEKLAEKTFGNSAESRNQKQETGSKGEDE